MNNFLSCKLTSREFYQLFHDKEFLRNHLGKVLTNTPQGYYLTGKNLTVARKVLRYHPRIAEKLEGDKYFNVLITKDKIKDSGKAVKAFTIETADCEVKDTISYVKALKQYFAEKKY